MKPEPKEMSAERRKDIERWAGPDCDGTITDLCRDFLAHISHLKQELSEMEKLAELNRADYQEEFRERRAAEQESARLREALAYMIFWNETKHHHDLTGKRECPVCKAEAALAAPAPSPEEQLANVHEQRIEELDLPHSLFGAEGDKKQEGK